MRLLSVFLALLSISVALAQQFSPVTPVVPPDPAELFRASFDQGYSDFYGRGLEADFARGSGAVSLLAYDRGNTKDKGLYRATDCEGVKARALSLSPGQSQRYAAAGNINPRRGTIALWVKFSQPLGDVHLPILAVPSVSGGQILGLRGRYKTVLAGVPDGNSGVRVGKAPWEPDEWHHIAMAWDETTGLKVYRDGEMVGESKTPWQTEEYDADRIIIGEWSHWGGTPVAFAVDELRIFSRQLADEEVRRVFAGEDKLAAVPAADTPAITAHRAAYLDWDKADLYSLAPASGDRTLLVRQVGIQDPRAVKSYAWQACDGERATPWPLSYHGYSFEGQAGLALKLFPGAQWNYVRAIGPCQGQLYRGLHLTRPEQPAWQSFGGDKLAVKTLDQPAAAEQVTFFADPVEEGQPGSRIGDIGFYNISAGSAPLSGSKETCYLSGESWSDWPSELGLMLQSRCETYDRAVLKCQPSPATGAAVLPLKGLRYTHFMLPPGPVDRPLGALRARLYFRNLKPGTVLWMQVNDPIIPTRSLADFELKTTGDWSGIQCADVTFDFRDYVIPNGKPLWVWLMASDDAELVWDGANAKSCFELQLLPADKLADEYCHDQLAFAKDRFIHVSEPRPWGKVAMADLAQRVGPFMELHRALEDLHARFPENPYASAMYIWTHPAERVDRSYLKPPTGSAPGWALYQRACLKRYLDFANWWIDNRQVPNGEFGHGYGDDTDLINDWLSLAKISDPDGRVADSVRRLADYCWNEGPLQRGINARATDPLHAYEEGLNAVCTAAAMYPGDPVYRERLMEGVRTVEEELTGIVAGRRHFKSCNYGAKAIITEPPYNRDHLASTLMLHGALLLGNTSRNPRAMKLVQEYGDAWLQLAEQALAADPEGYKARRNVLPETVKFDDGSVVGKDYVISGYGSGSMYLALHEWTGDERYFLPEKTWIEREVYEWGRFPGWLGRVSFEPYREGIVKSAEAINYTDLSPAMGNDTRTQNAYLAWGLTGNRKYILDALKASWERIELLLPMHTWIEQSADRVAISKDLVDRMYLGGSPGYRNVIYPTHAVSWEGLSPDFAAWVLQADPRQLKIMAYNFDSKPQAGQLRLWRIEPGQYRFTAGPDANEDGVPDKGTSETKLELCPGRAVPVQLPPGQTVALQLELLQRSEENFYARCDLALSPVDTKLDAKGESVTVILHNVGNGEAPAAEVTLQDASGKTLATAQSTPLAGPIDCVPKTPTLTLQVPPAQRGKALWVAIDPAGKVPELYEDNNRVALR